MWASIWCTTISHAWNISSKIMDSFSNVRNSASSCILLHSPNSKGFRPRRIHCRSVRIHFSVVNPYNVFLHSILHLPNVPTSAEQEHDYCILGSTYTFNPPPSFMAIDCEIQIWNPRSNVIDDFGILDSKFGSAYVCYMWRLP